MKSFFVFIFLFVLPLSRCFSQETTFTLSLYYSINKVSPEDKYSRLDSLYTALAKTTYSLSIYGYADFLNTDNYNQILSKKRAEAVKNYLLKKEPKPTISVCEGKGENYSKDNSSSEGEPSQRRVDVVVSIKSPIKKIGSRENVIQNEKKEINSAPKKIEDLEAGESMAIKGLNFIPGRHFLVKSAIPILEELLSTLKEHPNLKIEIQGHICCLSIEEEDGLDYDTQENKLSENRAKAIYGYLIKNGIDASQLTYKGYGHTRPKIIIERSPEEEQINRRVEIKILEN